MVSVDAANVGLAQPGWCAETALTATLSRCMYASTTQSAMQVPLLLQHAVACTSIVGLHVFVAERSSFSYETACMPALQLVECMLLEHCSFTVHRGSILTQRHVRCKVNRKICNQNRAPAVRSLMQCCTCVVLLTCTALLLRQSVLKVYASGQAY